MFIPVSISDGFIYQALILKRSVVRSWRRVEIMLLFLKSNGRTVVFWTGLGTILSTFVPQSCVFFFLSFVAFYFIKNREKNKCGVSFEWLTTEDWCLSWLYSGMAWECGVRLPARAGFSFFFCRFVSVFLNVAWCASSQASFALCKRRWFGFRSKNWGKQFICVRRVSLKDLEFGFHFLKSRFSPCSKNHLHFRISL